MRRSLVLIVFVAVAALRPYAQEKPPTKPVGFAETSLPSAVSGLSPFSSGCFGQQNGTDYVNAAVEPSVAADPTNFRHLIGVWQQDRWSNGAASGLLTGVSYDSGRTWKTTFAKFSVCTGGTPTRASDPWVTISPDGAAYQSAIVDGTSINALGVSVSRSSDGGVTWSDPIAVAQDSLGDDKESITADPNDSNFVYAVWDRTSVGNTQPIVFSRTANAGGTWEAPQTIFSPGQDSYTTANQIVVLSDGTLMDVFLYTLPEAGAYIAFLHSPDRGATWSNPTIISDFNSIGVVDARTQAGIRAGGLPSAAVDRSSGAIYITWQDARFSGGQRNGIAMTKSVDGGQTWSTPAQVNTVPAVQAFLPTVATGPGGTVAITYYDFRQATSDTSTLPTNYWQIVSSDGGNTWVETPVAGPFDMLQAARSGAAYFLGDYQALVASGSNFVSFFAATNPAGSSIPSSIFALPFTRTGSAAWNGHVEVNRHPVPFSARQKPRPNQR